VSVHHRVINAIACVLPVMLGALLSAPVCAEQPAGQSTPERRLQAARLIRAEINRVQQALLSLEQQVTKLDSRLDDLTHRLERLESDRERLPGPPEAKVTLLGPPGPRPQGSPLRVRVTVDSPCYLSVFNIDPNGQITILYPLAPRADNFVPRAGAYDLPPRGTKWRVGSPAGMNTIKAVAALIKWPVTKDLAAQQRWPLIGCAEATISYEATPRH